MRESGILMHITSLPGPYGIGTMGRSAREFVDFLCAAGQHCWQILPLSPTGFGNSPYQSCSTYAGNHYLIDLDMLVEEKLLTQEELDSVRWSRKADRVDFGLLYENKLNILRKAFRRHGETEDFARFRAANDSWLPDYAYFMCLKDTYGGKPWYEWPEDAKLRRSFDAVKVDELQFYCFTQYLFFRQWNALREYAHSKGIRIIGDVPIYVPYDSVEVWKEPHLFQIGEDLNPKVVAGCPPDGFTEDGQLWGNPIYDWDVMKQNGYRWWISRLEAAGKLYDTVRLDHFRGLESYWAVPYGDTTARNGKWVKGPGMDFIRAVKDALPGLDMIAEDLGYMTQEVKTLRSDSGFPGMKVLQFGFDVREPSEYQPHTYARDSVCYTGTHDNMTMRQWFDSVDDNSVAYAVEYMNLSRKEGYVWGCIRTAMASVSDLSIIPMQDVLNIGSSGRMNFPGTLSDSNWTWRVKDGIMTPDVAKKLHTLTQLYGR